MSASTIDATVRGYKEENLVASDLRLPSRAGNVLYFIVAVLGFSFWFLVAVPFASHRETYWWLGMVRTRPFADAFGVISSTYRPLAQGITWLGFKILDPGIFPTSPVRQALLQGFVYVMFLLAWWLIYSSAKQRRTFALLALVTGGVFFSGYVHLFHIYGLFYVAVMLTFGSLFRFSQSEVIGNREIVFAVIAVLLVFWHPFATGLFVGFYFGFYLDTFSKRTIAKHAQAWIILIVGLSAIAAMVFLFQRDKGMPVAGRLWGFLVSYRTNELNLISSAVAFLLAQLALLSTRFSPRVKWACCVALSGVSALLLWKQVPLLLLWILTVLVKLLSERRWTLFFLTLAAMLLPFGGGIGTPMYGLFAIIAATYGTALGWSDAERRLAHIGKPYVLGAISAVLAILLMVRVGVRVPVVTTLASPLLRERERTYQLESVLAWLHSSQYCAYQVAFVEDAGNPVTSVESAISRRRRPPSEVSDVQLFWKNALQCQNDLNLNDKAKTALVTFDGPVVAGANRVFAVDGKYAGEAVVWVPDPSRQ